MDPTPEQLAWAAGFIDGEGSICISLNKNPSSPRRGRHVPNLCVGQIHEEPLAILAAMFGGPVSAYTRNASIGFRPFWQWTISSARLVLPALERLEPYLVVKLRQAELMIAFCRTVKRGPAVSNETWDQREKIRREISLLNRPTQLTLSQIREVDPADAAGVRRKLKLLHANPVPINAEKLRALAQA